MQSSAKTTKMSLRVVFLSVFVVLLSACSRTTPFEDAALATIRHDVVTLEILLNEHPDLVGEVTGFDGKTLLFLSLTNSPSFDCTKLLLERGADPNHVDVTGETPISTLRRYSADRSCEELLLSFGTTPKE